QMFARILIEIAFHEESPEKKDRHFRVLFRGFLMDAINKGLLLDEDLNDYEREIMHERSELMAYTRTEERIRKRLTVGGHAGAHLLPRLGINCLLPFGPEGEGVTAML